MAEFDRWSFVPSVSSYVAVLSSAANPAFAEMSLSSYSRSSLVFTPALSKSGGVPNVRCSWCPKGSRQCITSQYLTGGVASACLHNRETIRAWCDSLKWKPDSGWIRFHFFSIGRGSCDLRMGFFMLKVYYHVESIVVILLLVMPELCCDSRPESAPVNISSGGI